MGRKVLALGEVLLRLSTGGSEPLRRAVNFELYVGGAEFNTCASLSLLGTEASMVTALPDNELGMRALAWMRQAGVGCELVSLLPGGRMGLYFLETASFPRRPRVVYDRKGSAFCMLQPDRSFWEKAMEAACLFYSTGITPALGARPLGNLETALECARESGVPSCFDINYRASLWGAARARKALARIWAKVDHLIVPASELVRFFGMSGIDPERASLELAGTLGLKTCAVTARTTISPHTVRWSAFASEGRRVLCSPQYEAFVVDPIGAGDAFAAGYIRGILAGDLALGVNLGSAMAALKMTVPGDYLVCARNEIEEIASGKGSMRVIR